MLHVLALQIVAVEAILGILLALAPTGPAAVDAIAQLFAVAVGTVHFQDPLFQQ